MGTWSSKPFGNDTASDWIYCLEKCSDNALVVSTLNKIKRGINELDSAECEEVIAATAVIAAASASDIKGVPIEAKQWIKEKGYVPDVETIELSVEALSLIIKDSELLELWSEEGNPKSWIKNTGALLDKLRQVDKENLPDRKPKARPMPRVLHKLVQHPDRETNPKIKAKIKQKLKGLNDLNEGVHETDLDPPLTLMAKNGLKDEAVYLIKKGADVNVSNQFSSPPLSYACAHNYVELAEILINAGANVNKELVFEATEDRPQEVVIYSPALFSAAMSGEHQVIDLLVSIGADVFQAYVNGETLMHYASEAGNTAALKHFIKLGVDVNKVKGESGESPLHCAVKRKQTAACEVLLESGANPNVVDKFEGKKFRWEQTPLDLVEEESAPKLYSLLRKYGCLHFEELANKNG